MYSSTKYQLFVKTKCSDCDKILSELKNDEITVPTINIDTDNFKLPFNLVIFPALVKGDNLISYGYNDIMAYLKTD